MSSYRLKSSSFERQEEAMQSNPKKVIFLSVEGVQTEINYFEYLQKYLVSESTVVQIEVLKRKRNSGYASPTQVIELLEECVKLREGNMIPKEAEELFKKYSKEDIENYLNMSTKIKKATKTEIEKDLLFLGIDLHYRAYLKQFDGEDDYFAVVLDRDKQSHTREILEECAKICERNNYGFYITNPCFEFWLLLHLCDAKECYFYELDKLLENKKISNVHTFVSREVSKLANHNKRINESVFREKYLPNINEAIRNSQKFDTKIESILDKLGTNLPDLINVIKIGKEKPL